MTEQFKLVTNAQERKIFKTNATAIKIKCSNNFPRRYSVENYLHKLRIKRKFHHIYLRKRLFPSAKITLCRMSFELSFLSFQLTNSINLRMTFWLQSSGFYSCSSSQDNPFLADKIPKFSPHTTWSGWKLRKVRGSHQVPSRISVIHLALNFSDILSLDTKHLSAIFYN